MDKLVMSLAMVNDLLDTIDYVFGTLTDEGPDVELDPRAVQDIQDLFIAVTHELGDNGKAVINVME